MKLETDKKILGQIIKKYRKKRNFTQFQLAELVGLNEKQISRIEAGQNFPTYLTFAKLIEALDIEIENFVQNENQKSPKENLDNLLKNASDAECGLYFDILNNIKSNLNLIKKRYS